MTFTEIMIPVLVLIFYDIISDAYHKPSKLVCMIKYARSCDWLVGEKR